MGPEVVAAAALGGLALDAGGKVLKGVGEQEGQNFMAGQAQRAAQLGRIKADQTDVAMREELDTTLGMIDVMRSAANADPLSPTALAVKDREREVSDRNRTQAIANIRSQADEREMEADYRRRAGRYAMLGGTVSGASTLGRGIGTGRYG